MQCLLCKRNYSSCESYGETTYSEEIGVAYVVMFSQNSHSGTQEHDPE